jgi:hypothetical protein
MEMMQISAPMQQIKCDDDVDSLSTKPLPISSSSFNLLLFTMYKIIILFVNHDAMSFWT